jgi:hypothetical protein
MGVLDSENDVRTRADNVVTVREHVIGLLLSADHQQPSAFHVHHALGA